MEFAEFAPVAHNAPLAQGDVLESVDPTAPMWTNLLVVITADCDLAHAKHQGRVTCVPLLPASSYLQEFWLPRIAARHSRTWASTVSNAFLLHGRSLSLDRLQEWIARDGFEAVLAHLPDIPSSEVRQAASALDAAGKLSKGLDPWIDQLADALVLASPKRKVEVARNGIVKELRQVFTSTPGDAQFLGSVGPGNDEGYFAYLRHIEQVMEPAIALSHTRATGITHRRIASLQDRYTHALTLRFAQVFLAIGLPDVYEATRDEYSAKIVKDS